MASASGFQDWRLQVFRGWGVCLDVTILRMLRMLGPEP